jgi:cob(I)alamin adenosyltransferase
MRRRLTRITTKTGDAGQSGLADGSRRDKTDGVFAVLGDIDELNSALGVAIGQVDDVQLRALLAHTQSRLFDLGGIVATPGAVADFDAEIAELEAALADMNSKLEPLANFVLPGGHPAAAALHLARAVCRRAERTQWSQLRHDGQSDTSGAVYLNRLSDLLFVAARHVNRLTGRDETLWQPRAAPTSSSRESE